MQALTDFVIGLQYAAVERFDEANRYFTAAEDTEGWSNREGKEVLYLFLGTAANRTGDHDRAETHYRTALTLNEHYARAYLGLAEVDYQRAVQHHACSPGTVVPAELLEIKHAYEQALCYPAPKIADVETKVAFFTGRVYACLTRSGLGEYRDDTEQTLQLVFDEYYQRENTRVTRLVIDAHFVLALAYQALPVTAATSEKVANYRTAAQHYDAALALEPDQEWRAYYYLSLVYTYLQLHTFDPTAEWCAAAHAAYRDAQATRQTIHHSTPYYDAWHDDIVEELETSACQHQALRVSFFQSSSFHPTHIIDR